MKEFKLKDIVLVVSIIVVSILYFFAGKLIPEGIDTVSILGLEIGSFGFLDIKNFVLISKMKFLILFFAITWYFTCKHWWRSAILVIIILEFFKIANVFNSNKYYIDELEYLTSLPITIPLIILLVLFSLKLYKLGFSNEVRRSLDKEIDDVFFELNKNKLNKLESLRERIENAKRETNNFDKKKYLDKLISLRNEFYKSEFHK
jgi:hypothetical protein